MTAYCAGFYWTADGSSASSPVNIAVLAGTYPCRISKIDFYLGANEAFFIYNYASTSLTGGSTLTPLPLRGGAPATTATVKRGITAASGTATALNVQAVGDSGFIDQGSTAPPILYQVPGSGTLQFPFDYIVPPGSALIGNLGQTIGTTNYYSAHIGIYYEELRLSWSF